MDRVVDVDCECGKRFEAPASMRGGLANCPACGRAARVAGGPEPAFLLIVGCAAAVVLGVSGFLFAAAGPVAGLVALGIGAALVGLGVLAM